MKKLLYILITTLIVGAFAAGLFASRNAAPRQGSTDTNVLQFYPTATKIWVGTSDTLVVASSSGRTYLEVGNISGATTTSQALYCNFGDRASVVYEGKVIHASSSAIFNLDNLYRGALRCRFPITASTVTVVDF